MIEWPNGRQSRSGSQPIDATTRPGLSLGNRDRREQVQVNPRAHRQVADAVRMDLVARSAGRAFGDEFGAHAAVCGSSVTASKSATPSNRPPLRMNSLSALRLAS